MERQISANQALQSTMMKPTTRVSEFCVSSIDTPNCTAARISHALRCHDAVILQFGAGANAEMRFRAACRGMGSLLAQTSSGCAFLDVAATSVKAIEDQQRRWLMQRDRRALTLHTDNAPAFRGKPGPDIVGLFCRRAAVSGGDSVVAGAAAMLAELRAHFSTEELKPLESSHLFARPMSTRRTASGELPAIAWAPILRLAERVEIRFGEEYVRDGYASLGRPIPNPWSESSR